MAKNLSTFAIARMLHVDPGSVANWIDQKLLKAHRTPGGHRRVKAEDLLDFLREHQMPVPPEVQPNSGHILVVDDEPAVAEFIARAIASACPQHQVLKAHDGFEAGRLVAEHKPCLVILDLRMPGLDGFEVCRRIKEHQTTRHTEILAVTAYPSPENLERIKQCGARACLSKPLDMQALLEEVQASLQLP